LFIIGLYRNIQEVNMFAYASTTSSASGGYPSWMSWVIILVMFAAIYFLTIRPQNKRDKEARKMRESLKPGDEIVTIGGIYGKVVRVADDRVIIMVGSEKTKLEMAKSAISQVLTASSGAAPSSSKTKAEEPEKEVSRPTPKTIKKLGAAKEAAEETAEAAAEAVEKVEAAADEAAKSTEG